MGTFRLYTGPDAQSHIETIDAMKMPDWTKGMPTTQISFSTWPVGRFLDWHPAPRRQFVIILSGQLEIGLGDGSKQTFPLSEVKGREWLRLRLDAAHDALFEKARAFREANTRDASSYDEMKKDLKGQGGFVRAYFNPDRAGEAKIKEETKATVRVIPFEQPGRRGKDVYTGEETETQVLFAQAY